MKKSVLLHACCGPCSTHCIDVLREEYDIALYFYNPNILPADEYTKRLDAIGTVAQYYNVPLIVPEYVGEEYLSRVKGLESEREGGQRCTVCFNLRLEKTAEYAKIGGYDLFATTLTVSPHKNAALINTIGAEIAQKYGVEYLPGDFKKKDGFKHSIQLSRMLGLYRQTYCGCGLGQSDREHKSD